MTPGHIQRIASGLISEARCITTVRLQSFGPVSVRAALAARLARRRRLRSQTGQAEDLQRFPCPQPFSRSASERSRLLPCFSELITRRRSCFASSKVASPARQVFFHDSWSLCIWSPPALAQKRRASSASLQLAGAQPPPMAPSVSEVEFRKLPSTHSMRSFWR